MRFAHRFFVLWGSIAVICFAISAAMTWSVVRVYQPRQAKMIGIYGDSRLGAAYGALDYYALARPAWIVTFPAGSRFVVLPGAPAAKCQDARNTFGDGPIGTLDDVQNGKEPRLGARRLYRWHGPPPFDVYQIDVTGLQTARIGGRIACFIDVGPSRESLTSSSIGFDYMLVNGTNVKAMAKSIEISVTIPEAENMQVYGGKANSSGGTRLVPGTQVFFKYVNVEEEGRRDILFILIGAFIAFGAATTLEALRPYVELIARRET